MKPIDTTFKPKRAARLLNDHCRSTCAGFYEQIEHSDFLLDYQFDQESADVLLMRLKQAKCYPASASALEKAMAGIAVTVKQ